MEINELPRQGAVPRPILAQECTQRQCPVSRGLLLDRNADPERRVAVRDEGRKSLAKSAWTGEQINDAEVGRQNRLLTIFSQSVYTRFRNEDQDASDRYCGSKDPILWIERPDPA